MGSSRAKQWGGTGLSWGRFRVWRFLCPRDELLNLLCNPRGQVLSLSPLFRRKKLRLREHTPGPTEEWLSQDLNTDLTASKDELSTLPYPFIVLSFLVSLLPLPLLLPFNKCLLRPSIVLSPGETEAVQTGKVSVVNKCC